MSLFVLWRGGIAIMILSESGRQLDHMRYTMLIEAARHT